MTGKPVIKAIKVQGRSRHRRGRRPMPTWRAFILYDAKAPETLGDALPGGNGHAFDWALLEGDSARPSCWRAA